MRKLILLVLALLLATSVYAADRVKVQVEYRKALWVCPKCGLEEVTDLNVGTPSTYEHTCKNGHWFNSFKEYNGVANYSQTEYTSLTEKSLSDEKTAKVNEWIYSIKNPPPYVEPTKEELEAEKAELEARVSELTIKIEAKTEKVIIK